MNTFALLYSSIPQPLKWKKWDITYKVEPSTCLVMEKKKHSLNTNGILQKYSRKRPLGYGNPNNRKGNSFVPLLLLVSQLVLQL